MATVGTKSFFYIHMELPEQGANPGMLDAWSDMAHGCHLKLETVMGYGQNDRGSLTSVAHCSRAEPDSFDPWRLIT